MRSLIRVALVAIAVVIAVPAVPAFAYQAPKQSAAPVVIPIAQLPAKVRAAQKKAYPTSKITKIERMGSGATATYHLIMTGKTTDAKFTAAGKIIK